MIKAIVVMKVMRYRGGDMTNLHNVEETRRDDQMAIWRRQAGMPMEVTEQRGRDEMPLHMGGE
jgi:hypothetical protein